MNILFITGRYGKKASANGICVENIINTLVESNNVYCICYDDFTDCIDERYNVIKIKRGFLYSLLYKYENNMKISHIINNIIKIKNLFFLHSWPWVDPIYTLKTYIKARKICKSKNIGVVVGVHMPLSSLIVANRLKKKNKDIAYVAYFLDSLSGGTPLSIMSQKWNLDKKLKWEKKVLNNADKIIVMESSKNHHNKYNKDSYFYNDLIYLDVPLLLDKLNEYIDLDYFDKNKINVVFCGTANYPLRNIPYLLKVISNFKSKDIIFHFFGNSNCTELTSTKLDNVKYHSFVQHDVIPSVLNSADFLLNLGTKEVSTISGKIFEYMSFGKPIISSYSIDNESCIEYLKKYANCYLYDEREENVEIQAQKMEEYIIANKESKIDTDQLKMTFKNNLPETFKTEILKNKEKFNGKYKN